MHYAFPWDKTASQYHKEFAEMAAQGAFDNESALRLAILGSHTLGYFAEVLSVRLFEHNIPTRVWTGPYAQIEGQAVNPQSELHQFKPDFTLVVQSLSDALGETVHDLDFLNDSQRQGAIEQAVAYCTHLAHSIRLHSKTHVLLSNFPTPVASVHGSLDASRNGSRLFVAQLNAALAAALSKEKGVTLIDLDAALSNAGRIDVGQEKFRFLGDVRLSLRQSVMFCEEVVGSIIALSGKTKKCIVLDLDNTLWGGVVGEDGVSGIRLGHGDPVGKAFSEFQHLLLNLHKRGILLAVNSKNNAEDAWEAIRTHPEMVLRDEHFASVRMNWQDKATNLEEIAKELNIGLDSMVFIDDDAGNIDLVRQRLPQVTCILLPKEPSAYPLLLSTLRHFDSASVTAEDFVRGKMYLDDRKRRESVSSFGSYADFLNSLNLVMTVCKADAYSIPRISQMSMRTNQFNMTTKRYNEEDVRLFVNSPDYAVYWVSVHDRFGDYGVVGACILKTSGSEAQIDSYFISCRILGKEIETSFLWKALQDVKAQGIRRVIAPVVPTKKNAAFLDFYSRAGFSKAGENLFELDLSNFVKPFPAHIKWSEASL